MGVSSGIRRVAEDLLSQRGGHLSSLRSTSQALEAVLQDFHEHLNLRIGDEGFRTVLQLAQRRALSDHPVLEKLIPETVENQFLGNSFEIVGGEHDRAGCQALVDLLGEALLLLRELGRDQDWEIADLWPGLKAMDDAGIELEPNDPAEAEPG
jgi:hypothetical protein